MKLKATMDRFYEMLFILAAIGSFQGGTARWIFGTLAIGILLRTIYRTR